VAPLVNEANQKGWKELATTLAEIANGTES
jgi:hypothetical protein